jgi:hypothetical protein
LCASGIDYQAFNFCQRRCKEDQTDLNVSARNSAEELTQKWLFYDCKQDDQIKKNEPIGRLFTSGIFRKMVDVAQIFWQFFNRKSYVLILSKMGWTKLWAFFHKLIWSPCMQDVGTMIDGWSAHG